MDLATDQEVDMLGLLVSLDDNRVVIRVQVVVGLLLLFVILVLILEEQEFRM